MASNTFNTILYARRTLSTRDLLFFQNGGDDDELEAVFEFLSQGNQISRLETLHLCEQVPASWRCINSIIYMLSEDTFGNLRSLTVNNPFYSGLELLHQLETLIVEIPRNRPSTLPEVPIDGEWHLPRNGCLRRLIIRREERLRAMYGSDYEHNATFQVRLPKSGSEGPLRNVQFLSYEGLFSNLRDSLDLASICPAVEDLELAGRATALVLSSITLPPKLKRFSFTVVPCHECSQFPWDLSKLPDLVDLTITHQSLSPHSRDQWGYRFPRNSEKVWPLQPLLGLSQLLRLQILCADSYHHWDDYYSTFLIQLATTSPKAHYQLLDLRSIPMNLQTATILQQAYPHSEVLCRVRHYDVPAPNNLPHYPILIPTPQDIGSLAPCPLCAVHVGENVLKEHKELVCPNRKLKCPLSSQGCAFEGNRSQLEYHTKQCPYYLVLCVECIEFVHISDYHDHSKQHEIVLSRVPKPALRRSAWQSPEFRSSYCISCHESLPSRSEAQKHVCPNHSRKDVQVDYSLMKRGYYSWGGDTRSFIERKQREKEKEESSVVENQ